MTVSRTTQCKYSSIKEQEQKHHDSDDHNVHVSVTSNIFSDKAKLAVTLCILTTEMFERVVFYGVAANQVLFCTSHLEFSTVDATTISFLYNALANLFPVLGGYVSDSWAGRFRTIFWSGCLNFIGLLMIQASAIQFDDWFGSDMSLAGKRSTYLLGAMLLTLGTGGIKANISPFGAEQLKSFGKDAVQSFFSWFFWAVNIGAFVAFTGVAYLQQNVSFTWGIFILLLVNGVELVIFVLPRSLYLRTQATSSVITTALKIMRQGCCKKTPPPCPELPEGEEKKLMAPAKKSYGGDHDDVIVDGLVNVVSAMPFCVLVIMYYAIFSQMSASFFLQSERMDVRVGPVKVPAAMLNCIGNISIILLAPIIDRIFYPFMKKIGLPLSYLKRIGIGMVLSAVAMVVAGVVEIYRKEGMELPGGSHVQVLANENFTASYMSVFVQVPQFALIGASEVFVIVTCLEFSYTQAPVSLQGLLSGLFLAAWGLGSLLSMVIVLVVEEATKGDPWYGNEINHTKMEYLMFLFAVLMAINFLIFCVVAHFFKYSNDPLSSSITTISQGDETTLEQEKDCKDHSLTFIISNIVNEKSLNGSLNVDDVDEFGKKQDSVTLVERL